MKLVNAKLYEEEIKHCMWKIWYDEKYQYYFGGAWRRDYSLDSSGEGYQKRAFAVLNNKNELLGVISYSFDPEIKVAQWFGAINFSNDKISFGKALKQVLIECFMKYGAEVVEWNLVLGNPAERIYDKACEKFGGHIIGIKHKRAKDLAGNICDEKVYEVLREDFLKAYKE